MGIKHKNNATGTLAGNITDLETAIPLTAGQGARFPSLGTGDYFYATLADTSNNLEVVKVTARVTDTLTVVRGQDGTVARAYVSGDRLELRPCTGMLESMDQEALDVVSASGTDAYTGNLDPVPNGYNTDQIYFVKFGIANTVAAPTLNLNIYGVKTIKKAGGNALVAGDIKAGMVGMLHYDGTDMILLNPASIIGDGVLSPSQITSSQNNYNPTGLATAQQLRISSSKRLNITGLVFSGQSLIWVHNIGTFPIRLTREDAASAAANRFTFGHTLGGGQSMFIWYDAASSRWRALSLPEPIGTIKDCGSAYMPEGYIALGQTPLRTDFPALFNELVQSSTVTITIASPGVVTWTGHELVNGQPVKFTTTGTLPTGISPGVIYFVINAGADTFEVAATPGGASINTSGTQSGTHTGIHAPWGDGDGSTTFALPPAGRHSVGAGTPVASDAGGDAEVDIGTDRLTVPYNTRRWRTGMPVIFTLTSGTITGLTSGNTYYVVRVSTTQISLASSLASAQNGTVIDMTAKTSPVWDIAQTGELRFIGERGGEDDHPMTVSEMLSHRHTQNKGGAGSTVSDANRISDRGAGVSTYTNDNGLHFKGGNTGMNAHGPFKVVTEGIRYC